MGVYKGGANYYHSISENLSTLSKSYQYSNGYFGKKAILKIIMLGLSKVVMC